MRISGGTTARYFSFLEVLNFQEAEINYSVFKLFTGFISAALMVW